MTEHLRRPIGLQPTSFHFLVPVAILLLAAVMRLTRLQDLPPGLVRDEVLNADIVTFIWQGRLSLFFREGFGHEPLYHYLVAPFQRLVGDNFLAIRLPSVLLGLLLVAVTMRWARSTYGKWAATTAGLLLAVSWWPIIFSRIGLRPILEPLLLVLMAHYRRRPLLSGLFLALAVYTYTAARVALLIPAGMIVLLWLGRRRIEDARSARQAYAISLVTAVVLTLPLWITLWLEPDLQARVQQLSGPLEALAAGNPGPILWNGLVTLGVFSFTGDPLASYVLPNRPLFEPLTALLFYGGVVVALARRDEPNSLLPLVWLAVTLMPSVVTPDAPSLIRMIGAMPVVYLLPGLSLSWLRRQLPQVVRGWPGQVGLTFALVALILGVNLGRTVRDGFVRWPALPETRLKYQSVWLDISRDWSKSQSGSPVIADSWYEPVRADSFRRDLGDDPQARWVQNGLAVIWPAGGGDNFLYVPEFAPLVPDLVEILSLPKDPWRSSGYPSFTRYALTSAPPIRALAEPIQIGGVVTLLGSEWRHAPAGGELAVVTFWQVNAPLPGDLTLFTHLLDGRGEIVTQHDGLDAVPATLLPGDRFLQFHFLALPESLPAEGLTLQTGMYTWHDGRRLARPGEPGDRIILATDMVLLPDQAAAGTP